MVDYSVYSAELALFNCDIGLLKIPKSRILSFRPFSKRVL